MQPVLAYLLKMLLCSAVLLGYYWVALRNERFHQWNRFYLLSAFVLSVVIPFFNIPLLKPEEPTAVITLVGALPWNQNMLAKPTAFAWGWKETGMMVAALVSLLLLLHLLVSVVRIVRMYKRNTPTYFNEVSVVITEERSAPFSFFRWLFWRSDIDPDTENGQRMLQHELTHISERHSADKLFVELLLIVCWVNPFFWLMRRELYAIHEFLADQKAIARHDGAAFAAMILQATQTTPYALSNPFFSSHLKRRLQMITNSKSPKYSYLRRISGLVLMVATTFVLALSIEQVRAQQNPSKSGQTKGQSNPTKSNSNKMNVPDSIQSARIITSQGISYVHYQMKDGRKLVYELNEAKKNGYFIPYQNQSEQNAIAKNGTASQSPVSTVGSERSDIPSSVIALASNGPGELIVVGYPTQKVNKNAAANNDLKQTLSPDVIVLVDGRKVPSTEINNISPSDIAAIQLYKGEMAIAKFGTEASAGVVEIITKANSPYDRQFFQAEQMPAFPGGYEGWHRYLARNIMYPAKAQDDGIMGAVKVEFIVDTEGTLRDIRAMNDPGGGLAEEAVRLIKSGPKWEPAVQNGKPVMARTSQTITFRLE